MPIWGQGPGHPPHDEDPGHQGDLDDVSCPHRSLLLSTRIRCGGAASRLRSWEAQYTIIEINSRVEAVSVPKKRTRRGRPLKTEVPQVEVRYRLVVYREALVPSENAYGWTVLATTLRPEVCTDADLLQAYQEQHITVEPGFRWIKNPAAISPV